MTSIFIDKSKKLRDDINKAHLGLRKDQPIIICINGGWLAEPILYGVGEYHPIVKAVLPVGERIYWRPIDGTNSTSSSVVYRDSAKKEVANSKYVHVPTNFFLDHEHSHISAVVFFNANASRPMARSRWGCDFVTVHNPLARQRLRPGAIRCGMEYLAEATDENLTIHAPQLHEES